MDEDSEMGIPLTVFRWHLLIGAYLWLGIGYAIRWALF